MLLRWAVPLFISLIIGVFVVSSAWAGYVSEQRISDEIIAPYSLGQKTDIDGVWELLNGSGAQNGYVIESEWIKPLPGFSGTPINLLIIVDLEGVIIDVKLLNHREPIFISGLGESPLRSFLEQYRGHSINSSITVSSNYGSQDAAGSQVYFDGVTKATASVRIAHESILAAAREVAKVKLGGLSVVQDKISLQADEGLAFSWNELVTFGFAKRMTATHGEVRALFKDTRWQWDDPFRDAADEELYADLWVLDVSHPHVARSVMSPRMLQDWESFRNVSPDDQTVLLIENASHGLIDESFVRNTSPPLITARQDQFPLSIRDADLLIELQKDVPNEGTAMVIRIDRKQGFHPLREWQVGLLAARQHGMLNPEVGQAELNWAYQTDRRFFTVEKALAPPTPLQAAIADRWLDLMLLTILLIMISLVVLFPRRFVSMRTWSAQRFMLLLVVLGFIGWWGQGQLSIYTPLAVMIALFDGQSVDFLMYDPFSLLIWALTIVSFFVVGRALFCGWLCPFGILQEVMDKIAKTLSIPRVKVSDRWDERLKNLKYIVLLGLVVVALYVPSKLDKAVEIEPFKTAISVMFAREWYFVIYAVICLLASLFVFKAYCRYLCPLGALMALSRYLMLDKWIKRRDDCGSPCGYCKVRCRYQAIKASGEINYQECFGCLDCVDIYEDKSQCIPLILIEKGRITESIKTRKKKSID